MQSIAIALLVVSMMATIGLELTIEDLRRGLAWRRTLALALIGNVLLIPAMVYGMTVALSLPAGLATGLLICAVAPGGPTGLLFSRIARANMGFATALQVLLAWVGLFSAPLLLSLAAEQHGEASLFWPMFRTLALFQLLPLAAGMTVRARAPELAKRLVKVLGITANALLALIIISMILLRGHLLLEQGPAVHVLLIGLVMLPLAPILVVKLLGRESALVTAFGFVTTVRNLSVSLLLAASFFDDPAIDAALLLWGFYMMVLPALFAAAMRPGGASDQVHARSREVSVPA